MPELGGISDEQRVPDAAEASQLSHFSFITMYMSGKLNLPPNFEDRDFTFDDLIDLGSIDAGTYGRVSRMRHRDTGAELAVKRVRILTNRSDQLETNTSLRRLRTELDAIRRASDCPQIVQFYGTTFHEGDCLVCMELMDVSLEKLYRVVYEVLAQPFPEKMIGYVAVSTLCALNHLKNSHSIIHRDVKPSNILLDRQGRIKLCDFGISGYLVDSIAQSKDAGCRPYMAPERLVSTSHGYDIRSDVWSLGITLVEIARGHFPYPNFSTMPIFEQLQHVVYGDAPVMSASEHYSLSMITFVNSCLIKERENRPNFQQLMTTEFYLHHHNDGESAIAYVAGFVRQALAALGQRH